MKKIIFTCLICLITCIGRLSAQEVKSDIPSVKVKTLDGKAFNTSDIANDGKPIIIDFWATWCKPCVAELNAISENYDDWQEKTGVKLIAVAIDDSRSSSSVAPLVNGKGWDYEVYLDENGDLKRAMNVNNVPHLFILNGNGKIVSQHNTYAPGDEDKVYSELKKIK